MDWTFGPVAPRLDQLQLWLPDNHLSRATNKKPVTTSCEPDCQLQSICPCFSYKLIQQLWKSVKYWLSYDQNKFSWTSQMWTNCFDHNSVNSQPISLNVKSVCGYNWDNQLQLRSSLIPGCTWSRMVPESNRPKTTSPPVQFFPYLGITQTGCAVASFGCQKTGATVRSASSHSSHM
jgi:hypothetical protein